MEKYLKIGKIVNTHGFRGDVKAQPWCDCPEVMTELDVIYRKTGGNYIAVKVQKASVHKEMVLLKLEGIDDFDKANALREEVIYADRDDIVREDGSFFIADIIGLEVKDVDTGKVYGKLKDVTQYGIHDIYTVKTEKGEVLIPAVNEFVKKISLEEGIFVKPIEGMFDEV
ncbi:MAG: 16S rRNA processing protein RimM [Clostridia bacterium]|nr:16S rRNA processing protein RimM [Clostridia bacterium]